MSLSGVTPTSKLSLDELCFRLMDAKRKGMLDGWEKGFAGQVYGAVKRKRISRKQLDKARLIVHEIRTGKRNVQQHVIDYLDDGSA